MCRVKHLRISSVKSETVKKWQTKNGGSKGVKKEKRILRMTFDHGSEYEGTAIDLSKQFDVKYNTLVNRARYGRVGFINGYKIEVIS